MVAEQAVNGYVEEDQSGDGDDAQQEHVTVQAANGLVRVNTSALEEKTSAMQALANLANDMGAMFFPYVQPVMQLIAPLMLPTGSVHDELRSVSLCLAVNLIDVANAAGNRQGVVELFNFGVRHLLQAIESEQDMDVLKCAVQALKEAVLSACRPLGDITGKNYTGFLNSAHLKEMTVRLSAVMQGSLQRRSVRIAERRVAEDHDETDMEMEELANQSEEELLYIVHEAVGALIRTHKEVFLPVLEEHLMPLFARMSQEGAIASDRKIVVFVYDDLLEFGGPQVHARLLPHILDVMIRSATPEEDRGVRQGAVYGIGVGAEHGGSYFSSYAQRCATALIRCIAHNDSMDDFNGNATDNAISALGKICLCHAGALGSDSATQILQQYWLGKMPLQNDAEESVVVTKRLCDSMQNPQLAQLICGAQLQNLMQVFSVLFSVAASDPREELCNDEVRSRIASLLKQLYARPELQPVVRQLPAQAQQLFAQLLAA